MFPDIAKLERIMLALLAVQEAQFRVMTEVALNSFGNGPGILEYTDAISDMKTHVKKIVDEARR